MTKQSKYEQFLNTYSGKSLLEKYSLAQEGLWRIRGEDPNCDFGGNHYQLELELDIVEGKLEDVIRYGVELPSFWQWGGGGDFTLISKPKRLLLTKTNVVRSSKHVLHNLKTKFI